MYANTLSILEYDQIKEGLKEYTVSGLGKRLIDRLQPYTDPGTVENVLRETTEAVVLLRGGAHVPLHGLHDITEILERVEAGAVLAAGDLLKIGDLLRGCGGMKRYMKSKKAAAPTLCAYAEGLADLAAVESAIDICLEGSRVSDAASARLAKIRQEMKRLEARIQEKLQSLLASAKMREYLQEAFVSVKDGRYCIPVKATYKYQIEGTMVAASGSGATVFIEPAAVRRLAEELLVLRAAEEAEEYQILATLTGDVAEHLAKIRQNVEIMAAYDFALAKGKYSLAVGGTAVPVNSEGRIRFRAARHPLLRGEPIPLDFHIGRNYRILVITGPNTGGKTVALKTVGLLTLMVQSGLHIPVLPDSEAAVFRHVLADIGDGQSIQQSLSTFSSHIGNIAVILEKAGRDSLVLLDEIGTGTDPAEGAALAAAILDELAERGAVAAVSTHYSDIKRYADTRPGFRNGCMEFDPATLQPLYRLKIGEAGSSNAFWIAARLGLKPDVLQRARGYLRKPAEGDAFSAAPAAPPAGPVPAARVPQKKQPAPPPVFAVGDCVSVPAQKALGIILEAPDSKGICTVLIRGKRVRLNHKRLVPFVAKEKLYPEDYDMNIVLLSKEDRRLAHDMGRKLVEEVRTVQEGKGEE
ncbi:MAG: endonuclease MutS2 [bacterium]